MISKLDAEEMKETEALQRKIEVAKEEQQMLEQSISKRKGAITKFVSGLGLKDNK